MGMFNVIKASTCSEVVGKCYPLRRYDLPKSTTKMSINGCWWRHPKRRLYPMHEVWSAEGGGQSLRHNFQYAHERLLCQPVGILRSSKVYYKLSVSIAWMAYENGTTRKIPGKTLKLFSLLIQVASHPPDIHW